MTLLTKILIGITLFSILGSIGFMLYKQHQLTQAQLEMSQNIIGFKQLKDDIARSQSEYASRKDLEAFATQNNIDLKSIKDDIKTLNTSIVGINQITAISNSQNATSIPSTNTSPINNPIILPTVECNGKQLPCPDQDKFGYMKNKQNLELSEKFPDTNVPIGSVSFDASTKNPWGFNISKREYKVVNVISTNEDTGRDVVYNKLSVNANGKNYDIKINTSEFIQQYPGAKISWFNPKVYLGLDATVNVNRLPITGEVSPNIGMSIASYGKTKTNPDIVFPQVSLGYGLVNKNIGVQISPIQINLGGVVPLIKNTYVGPTMGIGTDGTIGVGIGMRVGL